MRIQSFQEKWAEGLEAVLEEIRWHGRAGQGVITASRLLAHAAILDGLHAQAFPEFGPERLGSPISGFTRIGREPIEVRSQIYNPTTVVVMDPTLIGKADVSKGLRPHGKVLINASPRRLGLVRELASFRNLYVIDAYRLALDTLGRPVVSTLMVGAVARLTKVATMGSLEKAVKLRFKGSDVEVNLQLIRKGYEEVKAYEEL